MRGLRDITETIRRYGGDIDWRELVDNCRQYGAQTYLYYALWAARELAGADVPPGVMTGLESSVHSGLIKGSLLKLIILRAVLRDWPRSVFVRICIKQACTELLSTKRPSQKIKGFLERVFWEFIAGARNRLLTRK